MKALYICADLGIPVLSNKGGAVHVRAMVSAFRRSGCDIILASPILNKSPWEVPAACDARILHLPPSDVVKDVALTLKGYAEQFPSESSTVSGEIRRILYNQELTTRLIRHFDDHAPDFIYERASLFTTAGVRLAQAIQRPLIVELNAPLTAEQSIYRGSGLSQLAAAAEQQTLASADLVLVVSDVLRSHVIERGVAPDRVMVLPNGVDPARFHPVMKNEERQAIRRKWQLHDGPVVGFVGGLRPWHGVEILPELLEQIRHTMPNAQMLIVGDGPLRHTIQEDFERRYLTGHVRFTGAVGHDDVASLIRCFDVAVAPYPRLQHDFYFSPLKLFEYLACGVPVVAPDVGQIAQIVQHGQNGWLYPADDRLALSFACTTLLTDDPLRKQLGKAASDEVLTNYTWDKNAQQILRHAKDLAAHKGTRA